MTFLTRGTLLSAALLLGAAPAMAQAAWVSAFQSGAHTEGAGVVAVDANHNQYLTGFLVDSATFGSITLRNNGEQAVFVAKRDPAGQWLWATASQGTASAVATDITVDAAGDVYIGGVYGNGAMQLGATTLPVASGNVNHGFVASLNSAGQWRWATAARSTAGDGAFVLQIAVNNAAVYATGLFTGIGRFDAQVRTAVNGSQDAFVAALDKASGQWGWIETGGGPDDDIGSGVATDARGNVYATGSFYLPALFNGQVFPGAGAEDIWVGSLNAAGQWRWVVSAGGPDSEEAGSIAVDPVTSEVAVVGYMSGPVTFGQVGTVTPRGDTDGFLATLDTMGTWNQVSQVGGAGAEAYCYDLAWVPGGIGELIVAGAFTNNIRFGLLQALPGPSISSNGESDTYVARWAGGTTGWVDVLSAGGTGYEEAVRVAADLNGGRIQVTTSGYFDSPTIAFGATTLTNAAAGSGTFISPLFMATADFGPMLLATAAEKASVSFTLYPNPAHTTVHLTVAATTAATQPLTVSDALGRVVRRQTLAAGQTEAVLDVRGLPAGLYSVRCGGVGRRLVVE